MNTFLDGLCQDSYMPGIVGKHGEEDPKFRLKQAVPATNFCILPG